MAASNRCRGWAGGNGAPTCGLAVPSREARAQGAHLAASSAAAHADEERPRLGSIGLGRGALGAAASRRSHLRSGGHTSTVSARSRRDVGAVAGRIASGGHGRMRAGGTALKAASLKSLSDSGRTRLPGGGAWMGLHLPPSRTPKYWTRLRSPAHAPVNSPHFPSIAEILPPTGLGLSLLMLILIGASWYWCPPLYLSGSLKPASLKMRTCHPETLRQHPPLWCIT